MKSLNNEMLGQSQNTLTFLSSNTLDFLTNVINGGHQVFTHYHVDTKQKQCTFVCHNFVGTQI